MIGTFLERNTPAAKLSARARRALVAWFEAELQDARAECLRLMDLIRRGDDSDATEFRHGVAAGRIDDAEEMLIQIKAGRAMSGIYGLPDHRLLSVKKPGYSWPDDWADDPLNWDGG